MAWSHFAVEAGRRRRQRDRDGRRRNLEDHRRRPKLAKAIVIPAWLCPPASRGCRQRLDRPAHTPRNEDHHSIARASLASYTVDKRECRATLGKRTYQDSNF